MSGICRTVNCVRRRLFGCGCGCNSGRNSCGNGCGNNGSYSYRGCDDGCAYNYRSDCSSRYSEPDTNIICANQRGNGFTPCCDDDECGCHKRKHNCCD